MSVDLPIRPLALAVVVFSQACLADNLAEPQRIQAADPLEAASVLSEELDESDLMLDLAREIPGFAGFFYEPDTDRVVITMNETNAAGFLAARQAVLAKLADYRLPSQGNAHLLQAVERVVDYSFIDLARHRARLRSRIFAISGVATLEVDEEFNRIKVGLVDSYAREAVRDLASKMAIPVEMLSFWLTSPVEELIALAGAPYESSSMAPTLREAVSIPDNRLRGGYQVQVSADGPKDGIRTCTLGFTALAEVTPTVSYGPIMPTFVSASQCSVRPYRPDWGAFGQPSADETAGYELRDPRFSAEPCDEPDDGSACRYSGASLVMAFVDYGTLRQVAIGEIGRTEERIPCNPFQPHDSDCVGSIAIDRENPTILITSSQEEGSTQNERLDKVGAGTGWVYSHVSATCRDVSFSRRTIKCSDVVRMKIDALDYGAPVFRYDSIAMDAQLRGMVWGRNKGSQEVYFSPLSQIRRDIGNLWVLEPGRPTIDQIWGPTVVPPSTVCRWEASVSGGIPPMSYDWSGVLTGDSVVISGVVTDSGWLRVRVDDARGDSDQDSIFVRVSDIVLESCPM